MKFGISQFRYENTGFFLEKSSNTVHCCAGISRFTTRVLQSGVEMPRSAIKTNIADSLNLIARIERPARKKIRIRSTSKFKPTTLEPGQLRFRHFLSSL